MNVDFAVTIHYICIMSDKKPKKFNREAFKKAIAQLESSGGKFLDNPTSSAAGRYHFLYRYIKDVPMLKGISKREFINRPDLQEKIMDMAIDGSLPGFPSYEKNGLRLKQKFNTNLRADEIAALTHFLGAKGVEDYLKSPSEFEVPGKNSSAFDYVKNFNDAQGTVPSFQSNPRRNYSRAGDVGNIPFEKQEGLPDFSQHLVETEPTQDIFSAPNENYDPEEFVPQEVEGILTVEEFALGGNIGANTNNDLVEFEGGGTHEENLNGGIPQGIGANGKLNTVEEDETKFSFSDGDYVFSNKITL